MSKLLEPLSIEKLIALPAVMDLATAGLAWGIGRSKAGELVRAGEFPCKVLKVGSTYRVRKVDLFASLSLNLDGTPCEGAASDGSEILSVA